MTNPSYNRGLVERRIEAAAAACCKGAKEAADCGLEMVSIQLNTMWIDLVTIGSAMAVERNPKLHLAARPGSMDGQLDLPF